MSEKVESRNRKVLDAACQAARERGFLVFTRADVAAIAGVATGSVNNAFGTMDGLRDAVMSSCVSQAEFGLNDGALADGDLAGAIRIVAQGLSVQHPAALGAPPSVRKAAADKLAA